MIAVAVPVYCGSEPRAGAVGDHGNCCVSAGTMLPASVCHGVRGGTFRLAHALYLTEAGTS